jgi:two-component system, OmpR family, sensor kinase
MSSERPSVVTRILRPLRWLARGRLRLRALLAVVSITLVVLVAFDFVAVGALNSYLMNQTDTTLRNAAQAVRPGLVAQAVRPEQTDLPTGDEGPPSRDVVSNRPGTGTEVENDLGTWVSTHQFIEGMYSVLFVPDTGIPLAVEDGPPTPAGVSLPSNVPVNLSDLVVTGQAESDVSDSGDPLRSVAVRTAHGTVVISTSLDDVDNTVDRLRLIMLIGSAAAVLLIGLGAFWLLRRGLRPIETMATQADRITAGDLAGRVTPNDPRTEMGRLATALNGMLTRIEAAVREREASQEQMRQFFADASHELRTPLASLLAYAELHQHGALTGQAQVTEAMRRMALETQRMGRLVDDMLQLARLGQHPGQGREPVDLTVLVTDCAERVRVTDRSRRWQVDVAGGLRVTGDEEQLRRAVDNLCANVAVHTHRDATGVIAASASDGQVRIEVSDDGPGVTAGQLPHLFERFYRAGTGGHRPGSGLGLAIVAEIAAVHGGTAWAAPAAPQGLRVTLTLPAGQPAPAWATDQGRARVSE